MYYLVFPDKSENEIKDRIYLHETVIYFGIKYIANDIVVDLDNGTVKIYLVLYETTTKESDNS